MKLGIDKLQDKSGTTWTISYLDGKKVDVRKYVLLDQPEARNAFVTDENNGIVLDDVLVGDTLYSLFVVQSSALHVRFRITKKGLEVEMCAYDFTNPRLSQATGSGEKVQSYKLKSVQMGVLHKS